MKNTRDLLKFGHREREEAARLLSALHTDKDKADMLSDGVAVEFNLMSGEVFLVDEDYNIAMMNGDILENWHLCPECGEEGFAEKFEGDDVNKCCLEYIKEVS